MSAALGLLAGGGGLSAVNATSAAGAGIGSGAGIGALGGPLGALGGALVGSLMSFGLGQSAQSRQWDKWKDAQTRGPLYRMIGLEEAGLNPIIAAKGGLGAGGGGFTPTPVASGGGGISLGSDLPRAARERKLQNNQIRLIRKQANAADAAANFNNAQADLSVVRSANEANQGVAIKKKALFYQTPEGLETLERAIKNDALPKGMTPALIQVIYELYQEAGKRVPGVIERIRDMMSIDIS